MINKKIKIFPIAYFDTPVLKSSVYTPIYASNKYFKNEGNFLVSNSLNNEKYNEMTAVYDVWKTYSNELEFVGICHYRRLLSLNKKTALSHNEILYLISQHKIILPKRRFYWPFSLKTHYIYSKKGYFEIHKYDLEILKKIIIEFYPEYLNSYNRIMKRTYYHGGHIFIMKKDFFDSYCEFTFTISFEIEKRLSNRKDQNRFVSALTEFTLDIWIDHNKLPFKEIKVYETESTPFIKKLTTKIKKIFK
jgi:hypothetical protein